MSSGVMLMWFILTGLSFVFVLFDIRKTPAHPVIKWAFIILAVFAGPLAAFFYLLGCREPLKHSHEAYVAAQWRQVLGSTMHCAAGDGIGIIAGAAIAAFIHVTGWADLSIEYALGFGFGWAFFQAFAMRDMAGGSYSRSLRLTFLPEFVSMNVLMAGMVSVGGLLRLRIPAANDPMQPGFWFVMSMALIVGFILAYPINWWLVSNGLKHGMITVRTEQQSAKQEHGMMHSGNQRASATAKAGMALLSILVLGLAVFASRRFSCREHDTSGVSHLSLIQRPQSYLKGNVHLIDVEPLALA